MIAHFRRGMLIWVDESTISVSRWSSEQRARTAWTISSTGAGQSLVCGQAYRHDGKWWSEGGRVLDLYAWIIPTGLSLRDHLVVESMIKMYRAASARGDAEWQRGVKL